jgi:hypothetical protein
VQLAGFATALKDATINTAVMTESRAAFIIIISSKMAIDYIT